MSASAHARQQRHGTAGPNPNENPGEGNSGGPSDPSDQLSNHRRPGDQDDESTGTVIDAAELAAFREYQANKARGSYIGRDFCAVYSKHKNHVDLQ